MAEKIFDSLTGINVASGFKLQAKTPLDVRMTVDTIAKRDALITENGAYEGMKVYVKETKSTYTLKGTTINDWSLDGGDVSADLAELRDDLQITNVKTLAVTTELTHASFGDYIADVYYNNNEIIYVTTSGAVRQINPTTSKVINSYTISGTCNSLFVKDDIVWVLAEESLKVYKINKTDFTLSAAYTLPSTCDIADYRFYVAEGYLYISQTSDSIDGEYNVIKYTLPASSATLSGGTEVSSSAQGPVIICYDYLNPGVFLTECADGTFVYKPTNSTVNYISYSNRNAINQGSNTATNLKAYFNNYFITIDSNTRYYLHDFNKEVIYTIDYEDAELPIGTLTLKSVAIKKITHDNKLQFYIGVSNGVLLKMVIDLNKIENNTGVAKLMYEYIDPNLKHVGGIYADAFKNTERIMLMFSTANNQLRILNENIAVSGGTTMAKIHDDLVAIKDDLGTKATTTKVDQINTTLTSRINTLSNDAFQYRGEIPYHSSTFRQDLNNYYGVAKSGIWYFTRSQNTPDNAPIGRAANEIVYVKIIANTNATVQSVHYTIQGVSFQRTYNGTDWTDWILDSGDFVTHSSTLGSTQQKEIDIVGFSNTPGEKFTVEFENANTAAAPTLRINKGTALPIRYRGVAIPTSAIKAHSIFNFIRGTSSYDIVGDLDTNTTYSNATTSASGLMSAGDKQKVNNMPTITVSTTAPSTAAPNSLWFKIT